MKMITRKGEIAREVEACLEIFHPNQIDLFIVELRSRILEVKVKFPLLEFCAGQIYDKTPGDLHLEICDRIAALKTEGGNVLLGIILQKRLYNHFDESVRKAVEYIAAADIWYVCDIIGERVFGVALLTQPKRAIAMITQLAGHPSHWVIRSLGAGIHYCTKKGLDRKYLSDLFPILLTMANTNDKEIRQGVGWAAKTIARFHPEIIECYWVQINSPDQVANWFRKKIEIGLNRNNYAKRN